MSIEHHRCVRLEAPLSAHGFLVEPCPRKSLQCYPKCQGIRVGMWLMTDVSPMSPIIWKEPDWGSLDGPGRGGLRDRGCSGRVGAHVDQGIGWKHFLALTQKQWNRKGCGKLELDVGAVDCHRILDPPYIAECRTYATIAQMCLANGVDFFQSNLVFLSIYSPTNWVAGAN